MYKRKYYTGPYKYGSMTKEKLFEVKQNGKLISMCRKFIYLKTVNRSKKYSAYVAESTLVLVLSKRK